MAVITIRGQMGSGTPEVGKLIAKKLNIDYVDREIIAGIAAVLQSSKLDVAAKEMPPGGFLERVADALGHTHTFGSGYPGAYVPMNAMPLDDTSYLSALQSVIKELADSKAIVIRGRGSQFILKDHPGAFHLLLVATPEIRVERVMAFGNIDEEAARKEIARSDSSHREFIRCYFKADFEDPVNYDMVINTTHLTFEDTASIVVNAVPFKEKVGNY